MEICGFRKEVNASSPYFKYDLPHQRLHFNKIIFTMNIYLQCVLRFVILTISSIVFKIVQYKTDYYNCIKYNFNLIQNVSLI